MRFFVFFISPVFANLPAGYTELEYIESTGTQYIDTGYIPDPGCEIWTDFALSSSRTYGSVYQLQDTATSNYILRQNVSSKSLQFYGGSVRDKTVTEEIVAGQRNTFYSKHYI